MIEDIKAGYWEKGCIPVRYQDEFLKFFWERKESPVISILYIFPDDLIKNGIRHLYDTAKTANVVFRIYPRDLQCFWCDPVPEVERGSFHVFLKGKRPLHILLHIILDQVHILCSYGSRSELPLFFCGLCGDYSAGIDNTSESICIFFFLIRKIHICQPEHIPCDGSYRSAVHISVPSFLHKT